MIVTEASARKMFSALGYAQAGAWSAERLRVKLNTEAVLLQGDSDCAGEDLALQQSILDALEMGEEVELGQEFVPTEKGEKDGESEDGPDPEDPGGDSLEDNPAGEEEEPDDEEEEPEEPMPVVQTKKKPNVTAEKATKKAEAPAAAEPRRVVREEKPTGKVSKARLAMQSKVTPRRGTKLPAPNPDGTPRFQAPTEGKPGVIQAIAECLLEASEESPVSKKQILAYLVNRFPDRDEYAMFGTIGVNVPTQLKARGYVVKKSKAGYWIDTSGFVPEPEPEPEKKPKKAKKG